jgi:ComEC/Rec2-related protein
VFDDFDYRAYLAQSGVHSLVNRAQVEWVGSGEGNALLALLYRARKSASAVLDRLLPEPAASLANGILLGIESSIPRDLYDAFSATGTSHIIVISGSNIALLTGLIMTALTQALGRRRAALPALLLVGLYILLVGAEPAALRAGLMGSLFVLAIYLGRQSTAYVSLCAAGILMTLLNPLNLWNLGFQLSFLATLGLILFSRPIEARLEEWLQRQTGNERRGLRFQVRTLTGGASMTLAAQITTLPLLVYTFGRLSLTGGLAALAGGLLWEPLGRVIAVIPWLFLTWTTGVVRLCAALPFATMDVAATGRMLAGSYYVILLAALVWREAHQRGWLDLSPGRAGVIVGAIAAPIWLAASLLAGLPDGRLHVTYIPGETSEAVLIETPAGQRVWVSRSGTSEEPARATRVFSPGRTVDVAIGEDAGELWPGAQVISGAQLPAGASLRLTDGVTLTRLACGAAPVLLLAYRDFRTLLPAALTTGEQECLIRTYRPDELRLTILKAPQPGTHAWPVASLIEDASPQLVLWPEGTTYPPATDDALGQHSVLRVPDEAAVEVVTDGERLWVQRSAWALSARSR